MTSSPSKSSYKWWETDDKTKRLYTELLAEKIAKSPKKSASKLTRSASSCTDLRSRLEALEGKGNPQGSPVKRASSIRSLTSLDEIGSTPQSPRKYTFETVTMDTLEKYEYIKSPKKKSLSSSPSSTSLSSLSSSSPAPSSGSDEEYDKKVSSWRTSSSSSRESDRSDSKPWMFKGNDKNTKEQERWSYLTKGGNNERDKTPTTPTKGGLASKSTSKESDKWKPNPMFMLMTSSSKPEFKSFGGKTYDATGSPIRKKISASKLSEVPEYGSLSSSEDSSDSGRATGRSYTRAREETQSKPTTSYQRNDLIGLKEARKNNDNTAAAKEAMDLPNNTKQATKNLSSSGDEDELDINQITKKFQALCETVEQLEFKMFEFSNDIQKLKHSIGIKEKDDGNLIEIGSPKHHFRHGFTLAAGKDLLAERATARALLMRQYSSPSKSPRNISKLMKDTGIDKEMAEVDANKTKALEEELRKVRNG